MSATATEGNTMVPLPAPSTGSRTKRRTSGSTRSSGRTPSRLRAVPSTSTDSERGSSSDTAPMPARAEGASSGEPLTLVRCAEKRKQRPVTIRESLEMARLYEEERLSYRQIGQRLGRSRATVRTHVLLQGVSSRTKTEGQAARGTTGAVRIPAEEILRTAEVYALGLSLEETARVVGLQSERAVLNRLRHSPIGVRSRSEAMLVSSHPRRLSEEKIARIMALHGTARYKVAVEVGVSHETVAQVWLRNGLDVPGGRRAADWNAHKRRPGPLRKADGVATAPLTMAITRSVGDLERGWEDLADAANVDSRLFRAWRSGESKRTHVDVADSVMLALDLLWWEVYDLSLAPAGDECEWQGACEQARKLWGDG